MSDLHWSPQVDADVRIVLQALIADLEVLRRDDIVPDLLIFSGDLAVGGDDADMLDKAWESFIVPVAAAIGVPTERIFVAPGNHDIARESVRAIPAIEETLRRQFMSTAAINRFIDAADSPSAETSLALKRLENFYLVHDTRRGQAISATPFLRTFKVNIEGLSVGVACLNTAWRATGEADDVDHGNLLLGERSVDRAAVDLSDCDYRIAIHHHPLDWLVPADRQASDLIFRRQFDLTCSGHMHLSAPAKVANANGSCVVSQAGSVFAGRGWFNGYNLIEVDLPTRTHTIHVRGYFDESRRFDRATNVCENGVVKFAPDERADRRRVDLVELFLRQNRQPLREAVAMQLNLIGADDMNAEELIRQFVVPPIARRRRETDEDEIQADKYKTYSVSELLSEPGNLLVIGERHSGKSSLAHYMAFEVACVRDIGDIIPVVVDLKQHKYNQYSLQRAIKNFYDIIPAGFDVKQSLEDGLFVFIVDNLPSAGEEMQRFADHAAQFPNCRWIAMGTPNFDGVSPDRLFNEHLGSFSKFTIHELNRAGVRAVARNWTKGSETEATTIYDAVMRQLVRDGLPRTPYMVSLLVWALQQKLGRQHLNEAMLLENIINHLIGKTDFRLSSRNAFSPRAKEITLQTLAQFLFDRQGIASENEVLGHLVEFFDSKKVPYVASDVLDKLVGCGVLKRDGEGIAFKYPAFHEYFMAKRLGADKKTLAFFLTDLNFLKVRRELELLAGLRQENDDLIEAITALLVRRAPKRFNKIDIIDFDGAERARLRAGTTVAQLNRIKRTRLTNAQFDEMMDEADRRALSRGERRVTESLDRADGDFVAAAREREAEAIAVDEGRNVEPLSPGTHMAAIDTLARVVRNSDFSDYETKGPATRMVLESWIRIYLLVLDEIKAMFTAVGETSGEPLAGDDLSTVNYLVSKFVFAIVGHGIVHHLAAPSIAPTLRTFLDDGTLSTGERLLVLFLLEDANDPAWKQAWSELISDRTKSGFVIDCLVSRLGIITHSKALDDDQALRVKEVVSEVERRLDWSPEQKSTVMQNLREAANLAALTDR